ncbi:helix-turn-helix domain-containing protein [Kribbella solani]|uniref:helix-turn-helix domain-containing protein n=1 Tax=Kribbella solani TaxID=236067 RepID=UPI0029BD2D03|nr:helix-turn-helix domain-containing protein [Kribbella solani]MDX2974560.1 helix-turn-helix domain-containing protein [Kribbella solani]MDX3003215.1 helix-turn-helix domain-containing protein [Kribbella solani]
MRRIDARSLRGLAHPLRMRILEAIELDGPATSSTLAARLGENTGTISWHLRLLAEHDYLEEDPDRGTKRERWWRLPHRQTVLDPSEFLDDPETRRALDVYLRDLVDRYYTRVRTYLDEDWPAEWQQAAGLSDWRNLHLTPAQLTTLNEELAAVIDRYTTPETTNPPTPEQGDRSERAEPGALGERRDRVERGDRTEPTDLTSQTGRAEPAEDTGAAAQAGRAERVIVQVQAFPRRR